MGGIDTGTGKSGSSETLNEQKSNPTPTENLKNIEEKMSQEEQAKQLKSAVEELNNSISPLNFGVRFGFSDDINSLYVSVYERETDKVIRKIPSEEAMQLMAKMKEIVGMIFDKKG